MDKYILQKDLPHTKAGVVYIKNDGTIAGNQMVDKNSYLPDVVGHRHERFAIHSDWVEKNPEWFKKAATPEWIVIDTYYRDGADITTPGHMIKSVERVRQRDILTVGDNTNYGVITDFFDKPHDQMAVGFEGFKAQIPIGLIVKIPTNPKFTEKDMKDWAKFHLNEMLNFWQTHKGEAMFPPIDIIFRQWQLTKTPT
jgi:hypothetical protein